MTADHPSTISMNRTATLHIGMDLARLFEGALHEAGYHGPVAVAGGFLRDIGLLREPKDLDIFIDGGHCTNMTEAKRLGEALCKKLQGVYVVNRVMPCYGEWAEDVAMVCNLRPKDATSIDIISFWSQWPHNIPVPESIDIVVLLRKELVKAGYQARITNDRWNQETFLHAVTSRADLRLNAIGATPQVTEAHKEWDFDAYFNRLVVQYSRGAAPERIEKRLKRLSETKYKDWTIGYEAQDGTVLSKPISAANSTSQTFIEPIDRL